MCSGWYNNRVTRQHARCNNENRKKLYIENSDRHIMSRSYTIVKKEGIWLRAAFDFGFNMKGVRKLFKLELLFRAK